MAKNTKSVWTVIRIILMAVSAVLSIFTHEIGMFADDIYPYGRKGDDINEQR